MPYGLRECGVAPGSSMCLCSAGDLQLGMAFQGLGCNDRCPGSNLVLRGSTLPQD